MSLSSFRYTTDTSQKISHDVADNHKNVSLKGKERRNSIQSFNSKSSDVASREKSHLTNTLTLPGKSSPSNSEGIRDGKSITLRQEITITNQAIASLSESANSKTQSKRSSVTGKELNSDTPNSFASRYSITGNQNNCSAPQHFNRSRRSSASSIYEFGTSAESFPERPPTSLIESELSVDPRHLGNMIPDISQHASSSLPSSVTNDLMPAPRPRLSCNLPNIFESKKDGNSGPNDIIKLNQQNQRPRRLSVNSANITDSLPTPGTLSAKRLSLTPGFLDSLNQQEQKRSSEALIVNETSTKSKTRRASLLDDHKKIIKDALLIVEKTNSPKNDIKTESIEKENKDQKFTDTDELEKESTENNSQFQLSGRFEFGVKHVPKSIVKQLDVKNIEILASLPLFANNRNILDKMDILIEFVDFKKDEAILFQSEKPQLFYWILQGECCLFREIPFTLNQAGEVDLGSHRTAFFRVQVQSLNPFNTFPPLQRLETKKPYLGNDSLGLKNIQKSAYRDYYSNQDILPPLTYSVIAKTDCKIACIPILNLIEFANLQMLNKIATSPSIFLEYHDAIINDFVENQKRKASQRKERRYSNLVQNIP